MTSKDLPQLKKFILLVDELYEHKVYSRLFDGYE